MEEILAKILALIPEASPVLIAGVAFAIDLACRLVKSQKPIGILHAVAAVVRGLAAVLAKLAALLDKVIPNRVEEKPKS